MEKLGVAIIGGGPAGLAAGIYAARGGASVKLFEEMFPGGQIVKTHRVENYPGLTGGPDVRPAHRLRVRSQPEAHRGGEDLHR